jgi:hypothetical protein
MDDPRHSPKGKDYLKYPRDWWQYLRGPGAFLAGVDLDGTDQISRSLKHLGLGLTGTVAFSAVNLKLAQPSGAEETAKLFQGSVLASALLLLSLVSTFGALLLSWPCGGREPRRMFIAFAYTYAFMWPTLAILLILNGWFIRWTFGVPYVELPPLGVSQGIHIERTFGNILLAAVPVTVLLWGLGFAAYAYVRAVMVSQKMASFQACIVAGGNILGLRLIEQPLSSAVYKLAVLLDPILGWILKFF